jgi:RNA polymerase sigma-70 factor, ECF subfamily
VAAAGRLESYVMSTEPDDLDLLRRLRQGDEGAFTALYGRWQGPLFRFALRMSGSEALAEDVTHEVFMALMNGGGAFDPAQGPLAAYLYGVARNQVRRRLERDRPRVGPEDAEPATTAPREDPLARLETAQDVHALRQALLSLPEHYREPIVLCDLEELSYEQAAAALGCAVGTIRSRLHRGRELLATKLRARRAAPVGARR